MAASAWLGLFIVLAAGLQDVLCYRGKVVNGSVALEGEFPFMVSLRRSKFGRHSCGASLLNSYWVLTAAHCVNRVSPSQINIQYGSNVLQSNSPLVRNISEIFVHKGYDPSNQYIHDIALLRLEQPLQLNDEVQAVRLPKPNKIIPGGRPAMLIGWGYNATGGTVQKHLQKVELETFTDKECSERHQARIHDTNLCAGVPEGGKGQCSGDSGGPLLVNGVQVGLVSWSRKPCAIAPYPGVFTEVSAYIHWMERTMLEAYLSGDESDESFEKAHNLIVVN